jgi:hypothetical protein
LIAKISQQTSFDNFDIGVARWYVNFHTKSPHLGKSWRALELKIFVDFMAIWYTFPLLGMLYHEKSGNPALHFRFFPLSD